MGKLTSAHLLALLRQQRHWIRSIPLVGPTCDTNLQDHKEALIEVVISVLFATIPIWLVSILLSTTNPEDSSFVGYLSQNLKDGEVLLLCSALIGPLLYFVFVRSRGMPDFPAARSLMLLTVLILVVSVSLFTLERADHLFGSGKGVDEDSILWWSSIAFGCAVVVLYFATCYRNYRQADATIRQKAETEGMVRTFNASGRGQE